MPFLMMVVAQALVQGEAGSAPRWTEAVIAVLCIMMLAGYVLYLRREKQRAKLHYSEIVNSRDRELIEAQVRVEAAQRDVIELKEREGKVVQRRVELEREVQEIKKLNPIFKKLVYNIGVVGISSSGKTALINKLIDPSFMDIAGLAQSQRNEQRERTVVVSYNAKSYSRTEHVMRFHEWGGEYLVEAQSDMLNMCRADYRTEQNGLVVNAGLQAIVFVVDIASPPVSQNTVNLESGSPNDHVFNPGRINFQVTEYFSIHSIKFLLNDRILPYLHMVVLFINKSDRLGGSYQEIEEKARSYFQELIGGLRQRAPSLEVIVGSAYTESSLHRLFSTLATRILPKDAWEGGIRPPERPAPRPRNGAGAGANRTEQRDGANHADAESAIVLSLNAEAPAPDAATA